MDQRLRIQPLVGNAEALPLPDGSVDRVVTGFTVRNVGDLPRAFAELRRGERERTWLRVEGF